MGGCGYRVEIGCKVASGSVLNEVATVMAKGKMKTNANNTKKA